MNSRMLQWVHTQKMLYLWLHVLSLSVAKFVNLSSISSNLIGYWGFEDNLEDSSGNNLDGTPTGNITFSTGVYGKCAYFNSKSYVTVADDPLFYVTSGYTISLWFKAEVGDYSNAGYGKWR